MSKDNITGERLLFPQHSLVINALSNWLALAVITLVGFFLTPFIIKHLGKTGYGIWVLLADLVGYQSLLDLGVTSATARYVALYVGQRNKQALQETLSTSLLLFTFIAILILCIMLGGASFLSQFFNVSPEYQGDFIRVVQILGVSIAIGFPASLFGAIIRAHERYFIFNIVSIIITLFRAGIIILLLSRGFGLMGVALATLATALATCIFNLLLCYILVDDFKINFFGFKWEMLQTLIGYGSFTTIIVIADILRFKSNSIIIGRVIDLPSVAVFSIAFSLNLYLIKLISSAAEVLRPRFTMMHGQGDINALHNLFLKSLALSSALSFGSATCLGIFAAQIIKIWVGPEFLEAVPVIWALLAGYSFAMAQNPSLFAMFALNKHKYFAFATLIEGIIGITLGILLAGHYGILGVALGTAIALFIIRIFFQPIYVSRIMGISLYNYWSQLVPPCAISAALVALIFFFPQLKPPGEGFSFLAISVVLYAIIFMALYFLISMVTKKLDVNLTKCR
jgi:O-antigen/teichoic acid export membrane protein